MKRLIESSKGISVNTNTYISYARILFTYTHALGSWNILSRYHVTLLDPIVFNEVSFVKKFSVNLSGFLRMRYSLTYWFYVRQIRQEVFSNYEWSIQNIWESNIRPRHFALSSRMLFSCTIYTVYKCTVITFENWLTFISVWSSNHIFENFYFL